MGTKSAFYGSVKSVASADHMALAFSRGVSVILLLTYFLYLFFQFKTHPHLFQSYVSELQNVATRERPPYDPLLDTGSQYDGEASTVRSPVQPEMQQLSTPSSQTSAPVDIHSEPGLPMVHVATAEQNDRDYPAWQGHHSEQDKCQPHHCKSMLLANRTIYITLLVISTTLIAICAESFASSFAILNKKGILGESFVGLIIIPVAGNVAENVTAVIVAAKNQMDLAISVALGSAIQIGLLVAPVIVLVGWALDKPMTLHFDRFGMVTLLGSILLVSFIILKGKTNYLEGAILCACFAAISYVSYISRLSANTDFYRIGAFLLPVT